MCGIAGFVGLPFEMEIAQKMLKTMNRRGPDDNGIFECGNCCLLHSRLSIIDPENGHQPMTLFWQGETYTIAYNGELYNAAELRSTLASVGHMFQSHCDTEVVLHAFAQWEEKCVDRFNGIFAFAIWSHKRKKLFLARDRMGVKPLFYKLHENGIIFASELKTILAHPDVPALLDSEGVAQILLLGPGRIPGSGVFKDIKELEAGCHGYFSRCGWHWQRYWKLRDREHTDNFEETAEIVRYLVTDAIKRQMVSDVPIGTFLSGGLDSSLISSVCAKALRERGEVLSTFSVDYKNNDRYFVPSKFQPNSDNDYIRAMQDYLQSEQHWTVLTPEELVSSLTDATVARDLPGMADVDFSLLLFCKEIRKYVKVALSGECADEIFGGYPWYRDPAVRASDGFPWSQNVADRANYLNPDISGKLNPRDYVQDQYLKTIAQCDILPGTSEEDRRIKEMVCLNQNWFMQTLLDRKDRMSMYHGLEVRVPFCDYRIAEYLYGVPWKYKEYNGQEKGLLRYAMADYLPFSVANRKKSPYPKTHDPQYLQLVSNKLKDLLQLKNAPIFEIVNRKSLEELLVSDYVWPWYGQLMKEPQTIAYMLQINAWLEEYNVNIV